ncbi:selenocysteine lyase-like [Lineus longissimus]|uniref:selenocysteine lyase-like n=1 Tax=Lineus longissimus TaxID=88925 RepID=UPI002B4DAEDF
MEASDEKVSKMRRVYLDYNATTPLEGEVLETIQDALETAWGNPSSAYEEGKKAKLLIQDARSHVADMVGGRDTDIIFTSGGTEANNLVIHSALKNFWGHHVYADGSRCSVSPHIITSNLEHDSVKLVLEKLKEEGKIELSVVQASKLTGRVVVEDVISHIRQAPDVSTCLITIMSANNETGIIQPIAEICERVRSMKRQKNAPTRIFLHTDAAQSLGKIPVDVDVLGVDYLTIVGHKFYGPRIGALYVRGPATETPLHPMFFGGGQERNFRPGTENTGMIAGLGKAAQLVVKNLDTYSSRMETIRDYLEERLQKTFGAMVHFNGKFEGSSRLPNTCNVSLLGCNLKGGTVLANVRNLQASVGSACHAQDQPSHILLAIGIPREIASNALRLSVGRYTTKEDIDLIITDLKQTVTRLEKKRIE